MKPIDKFILIWIVPLWCLTLAFGGAIYNGVGDRVLCNLELSCGINPNIIVFSMALLLVLAGIYFFKVAKEKADKRYWLPAIVFALWGIAVLVYWMYNGFEYEYYKLKSDQYRELQVLYSEKDGYTYIGQVEGENMNEEADDEDKERDFLLYVKKIEGKKHYYCGLSSGYPRISIKEKKIVQRYRKTQYGFVCIALPSFYSEEMAYKIKYDFDWDNVYVNDDNNSNEAGTRRVSQDAIDRAVDEANSYRTKEDIPKIVVEHQRSPQPVNVWHDCYECLGTGNCNTCGGAGWIYSASAYDGKSDCYHCRDGRCPTCGGNRGRYEVEYR